MTKSADPEICASGTFLNSYHKANTVVQQMAEKAVQDFVQSYRRNPSTAIMAYNRVIGLKNNCRYPNGPQLDIREFRIGDTERMLGYWSDPCLKLLNMGGHDLPDTKCPQIKRWIEEEDHEIPPQFVPRRRTSIILSQQPPSWILHPAELGKDWIYYLDDEQWDILERIYEGAVDVLSQEGCYQIHTIIGGPGTGKTCILLNLLKRLDESWNGSVGFVISDAVHEYLEAATKMQLERFRCKSLAEDRHDILLFDDPSTIDDLEKAAKLGKFGRAKVVVLAFDPLQLSGPLSDERYQRFVENFEVHEHVLHKCYRQKENVGISTKQVMDTIAESTPFLEQEKQQLHWRTHTRLTTLSNDLLFVNHGGWTDVHDPASVKNLNAELDEIKKQPGGTWHYYRPLLIAIIDETIEGLPMQWQKTLEQSRIGYRSVGPAELENIKGVEFQHVFVILGRSLYDQLEAGFEGSGQRVYNKRRLIRIPYSRAKDRLIVFVLD